LTHGVIEFYGRQRLDKERCSACGSIVNDAGKLRTVLLLDRDNVAFGTNRNVSRPSKTDSKAEKRPPGMKAGLILSSCFLKAFKVFVFI